MRTPSAASSSSSRWRWRPSIHDNRTAPSFSCRGRREHRRAQPVGATARGASPAAIPCGCSPAASPAEPAGGTLGRRAAAPLANACRAAWNREGNPASRHRRHRAAAPLKQAGRDAPRWPGRVSPPSSSGGPVEAPRATRASPTSAARSPPSSSGGPVEAWTVPRRCDAGGQSHRRHRAAAPLKQLRGRAVVGALPVVTAVIERRPR